MANWTDWRLLREFLAEKQLLQTELTDEPLDETLVNAAIEFINQIDDTIGNDQWSDERICVAAIQLMAREAGVDAGPIDGLPGPQTRHALEVMEYRKANVGSVNTPTEVISTDNPETTRDVIDAVALAKEPASIRYHNPGAMYPGPSATKYGSTRYEVIGGGHLIAVFEDDVHGAAAQFDLLYNKYTGMTMKAAIAKWCGGNSAAAYSQRVARETGVSPDTVLTKGMIKDPAFAIPLARAMAQVEAGKPHPMGIEGWQQAHNLTFNRVDVPFSIPAADPPIPEPVPATPAPEDRVVKNIWPRQSEVPRFYGEVGQNQTRLQLPYPMKLAWEQRTIVNSISVHQKVAASAGRVFAAVLAHYGLDEVKRLRLDLFGGSLNVRKMRGGSNWSMHSWGIAIDIDPDHNQLTWDNTRAAFARPEYSAFLDAWEAEGWVSLLRARNMDAMHFQAARL